MKTNGLIVNGVKYLVNIHFENRTNCRASIRKKVVNIRIPSFLSEEEKINQLNRMKTWAEKKLLENPEKFRPEVQKEYKNEDILRIGDKEYLLKIKFKDKKSSSAALNGNTIQLLISDNLSKDEQNSHISTLISRCIGRERLPKLQVKIKELNKKTFQPENK